MPEPIGILIPEGCLGLVYDIKTREVKAYLPDGRDYALRSWSIKLVDSAGNTTIIKREVPHA